ncbi:MAG: hypothetical protein AAF468_21575 [Pseudomonadota bacterium]
MEEISIKFNDSVLGESFKAQYMEEIALVAKRINMQRWSEQPLERAKAAVGYATLGLRSYETRDFAKSAKQFHFAGHAFRSVWMDAKAGEMYLISVKQGLRATNVMRANKEHLAESRQYAFDLRSLGRSATCFLECGQFQRARRLKGAIKWLDMRGRVRQFRILERLVDAQLAKKLI